MFKWNNEDMMEVDMPLQKAWDFFTNPNNWPKWDDRLDICYFEGKLTTGSKVEVKIKNKPAKMMILVTDVRPYRECKSLVKVPFFTQESLCIFQEISADRTRITLKVCVISFFAPFLKKLLLKTMQKSYSQRLAAFEEITEKV